MTDFKGARPRATRIRTVDRERLRLAPGETVPGNNEVSVAQSLSKILEHLKLADEHWLNQLRERWSSVAGDVARHTRPGRIEGKCLHVCVDSSAWLAELSRYGADGLLRKIKDAGFADKVARIRFEIDAG